MSRMAWVVRCTLCTGLVGAIALAAGCKEKNAGISTGRGQSVAYEEPTTDYYAPGTMASGQSSGYDSYGASSASYGSGNKHVVAKGETLYSIARAHYNDQAKWRTIYDANRGAISDPNKLSVGQELVIP